MKVEHNLFKEGGDAPAPDKVLDTDTANLMSSLGIKGSGTGGSQTTTPPDPATPKPEDYAKPDDNPSGDPKPDAPKPDNSKPNDNPDDPFAEVTVENITQEQVDELAVIPDEELTDYQKELIEQLKPDDTDDAEPAAIDALVESLELGERDEEGKISHSYENTPEGFQAATQDYAKKVVSTELNNAVAQTFRQYPELYEAYEHVVVNGYGMNSFKQEKQAAPYTSFNVEEETGQIDMITYDLEQKGLDKDSIEAIIKTKQDKGTLEEDASALLTSYKETDAQAVAQAKAAEKEQRLEAKRQAQERAKTLKAIINNKKIGQFQLDDQEAKEFNDFVFGTTKDGIPLPDARYAEFTDEQKLMIDYVLFKGDALETAATRKKQGRVHRRLKIPTNQSDSKPSGSQSQQKQTKIPRFDMSNIKVV